MANVLPKDKQIAIISALAEGSSMRAISRMTGVHGDTICRLGVRVGQGCAALLDAREGRASDRATPLIAAATLSAAAILTVVGLHMLAS